MSLVHVAVYFWVFLLGSVIGSYLNVVAYRLPLGKPLFWPPSSCPSCGSRIAIRDNIPVLGWILLDGKCRNCRQPISQRYPIVEAVVGGLFLLLALVELFTDGANIPYREFNPDWGLMTTVLFPRPALIAQYLFHAAWMSTLVAVVLIDIDKQRQPANTILIWMGSIAVISVALSPDLLPVKVVQTRWANEQHRSGRHQLRRNGAGLLIGRMRDRSFDGSVPLVLALTVRTSVGKRRWRRCSRNAAGDSRRHSLAGCWPASGFPSDDARWSGGSGSGFRSPGRAICWSGGQWTGCPMQPLVGNPLVDRSYGHW